MKRLAAEQRSSMYKPTFVLLAGKEVVIRDLYAAKWFRDADAGWEAASHRPSVPRTGTQRSVRVMRSTPEQARMLHGALQC